MFSLHSFENISLKYQETFSFTCFIKIYKTKQNKTKNNSAQFQWIFFTFFHVLFASRKKLLLHCCCISTAYRKSLCSNMTPINLSGRLEFISSPVSQLIDWLIKLGLTALSHTIIVIPGGGRNLGPGYNPLLFLICHKLKGSTCQSKKLQFFFIKTSAIKIVTCA